MYTVNMSVEHTLKSSKLKVTKARLAVAEALAQKGTPLKIERLHELLPTPKPDLATVYRILENFEKVGLVHQVDLRHGHAHYEWVSGNHHHHMVCNICHTIYPLHEERVEKLFRTLTKKYQKGFKITEHALEFFGICAKCA